jgi:hypothetical protein
MGVLISVKDIVVGEKTPYAEFVVTLSAPSQQAITVGYDWGPDSATSSDFTTFSGKLTFAPGVTSMTVRVAITDDTAVEGLEAFNLRLSSPVNAEIGKATATAVIVDNDTVADSAHPAILSVGDVVVDATENLATFTVMLDRATSSGFSVTYTTVGGSASAGSDYVTTSGVLTFGAGETVKTVSVTLPHDSAAEAAEMFKLMLGVLSGTAAGQVSVADGVGEATIGRHGQTAVAAPVVTVNSPFVGEHDGYVDFVVSLSAPSQNQVAVSYDWNPGTALSSDFSLFSGKLLFAPGVTTQTVRVAIDDDARVEGLETFSLRLGDPVNAVIANPVGVASIVDNDVMADSAHPANLSVRDVVVDASADTATFYVVLDKATNASFDVTYNTTNGTASSGSDYVASNGILVFGPGETVKSVTIALPHDGLAEATETFNLVLDAVAGSAVGQVVIADGTGQASIGRHGQTAVAAPTVSVDSPFVGEKDGYVDFVVTLSAPSQNQVTVSYDWGSGTAGSSDFGIFSGKLEFAPGVTTQTVRVYVTDDTAVEGLENFTFHLTSATNGVVANAFGVATMVDNDVMADSANRARLSVRDVVVDASADFATFYVVLDKATNDSFSLPYNTQNLTASAASDYIASSGTLIFNAGETVKRVIVPLMHDNAAEAAEDFYLTLGQISGNLAGQVVVVDGLGLATIGGHGQTAVASPTINVNNPSVNEKDGYVDFIVSLSAPSQNQVTVAYDWNNGTAGSSDFIPFGGKLVFAPGVTTQVVRVMVVADTLTEGTETFGLRLSSPVNGVIANPLGTATILEGAASTQLTGTPGLDTINLAGPFANYTVTKINNAFSVIDKTGATGPQVLVDIERIHFSDTNLALDVNGTGGQAYRIYQAAFNRTPDAAGLGFWMNAMDKGTSLTAVADGFMHSEEFIKAYGANPSSYDLVSKIYQNVLHRPPEAAGLDYWVNVLDSHQITSAQALSLISESAENQAAVITVIGNGFTYTPYGA